MAHVELYHVLFVVGYLLGYLSAVMKHSWTGQNDAVEIGKIVANQMVGNQSACNCNSAGHLTEMKQLKVEHSQQVIPSRSVASVPFTRRHARQAVQLSHRLITNAEIMHLYKTKVTLPSSYFNKFLNITPLLKADERVGDTWWHNKDVTRLWATLDFREWTLKHGLTRPKHLLTTEKSDPEPSWKGLQPHRVTEFKYNPNTGAGDLHVRDLGAMPRKTFDYIIFSQTLEHLYDPFLCVCNFYDSLVAGGYIYTNVPFINIPHMQPFHFFHYTPMGLAILFIRAGFEIVEFGQWGNLQYIRNLFEQNEWQAYDKVLTDNKLTNDPSRPAHVWLLARRPLKDDHIRRNSSHSRHPNF
eukprot:EG_transcript_15907